MSKLSITSLGKPIALGRTAEVYAWEDGQVLKLFHDWMSTQAVEYEAKIAQAVHAAGLPVPAAGEIIEIDSRLGLVYERTEGPPMGQLMAKQPWKLFSFARLLAELHAEMHASDITPEIPSQRQRLEHKIQEAKGLPDSLKKAALSALERMDDGERLCHGDFHPYNVLMTAQGPIIIDWIDATRGNPVADVVRSSVILEGSIASIPTDQHFQRIGLRWFHSTYQRHYFKLRPDGQQQFAAWYPIVAAGRLSEGITEQQDWLIAQVEAGLT
jgi:uncharacterized protein (TIGR02172 family)